VVATFARNREHKDADVEEHLRVFHTLEKNWSGSFLAGYSSAFARLASQPRS
jgi:hypothetical protein